MDMAVDIELVETAKDRVVDIVLEMAEMAKDMAVDIELVDIELVEMELVVELKFDWHIAVVLR